MTNFNTVVNQPAGKLIRWEKTAEGITAQTSNAKLRIVFYSPGIARITFTREDFFEDFSYAVEAKPETSLLEIEETDETLILNTSYLRLRITKNPVLLTFMTTQGTIINEDDAFGTSWNGEQVTTYKKLQEGERFIGLGEKNGPLDRKGLGYTNWNTDAYAYHSGTDPHYCSIPF